MKSEPLSYLCSDNIGPWEIYLAQVDRVTPYLGKLAFWVEDLKRPKRILIVDVPVQMDDGSVAHFEGYRVHHNTFRGPAKGGGSLSPGRNPLRGHGPLGLDDHQKRRCGAALRWG